MTSWTEERARLLAARTARDAAAPASGEAVVADEEEVDVEACCDEERPCCEHGGVCSDRQHPHFDTDEWIDAMRWEQTDRYFASGYGGGAG